MPSRTDESTQSSHCELSEHMAQREDPKSFQRENSSFTQRFRMVLNVYKDLSEAKSNETRFKNTEACLRTSTLWCKSILYFPAYKMTF